MIMKYAYFDTTIFNHLTREDIQRWTGGSIQDVKALKNLLKKSNIKIVTSAQVLGELAITSISDRERAKNLCSVYKQLCNGKIIKQWIVLINEEWDILYRKLNPKIDIYLNKNHRIYNILNELASGDFSNPEVQKYIKGELKRKKESLINQKKQLMGFNKEAKKAIRNHSSFESFYSALRRNIVSRKRIKDILAAHAIGSKKRRDVNAGIIIEKLDDMPHWNSVLRSEAVSTWVYVKQMAKVSRGDTFDMTDALHLASLSRDDYFVSDDINHRKRSKLLKPHLHIVDLKEFIDILKN